MACENTCMSLCVTMTYPACRQGMHPLYLTVGLLCERHLCPTCPLGNSSDNGPEQEPLSGWESLTGGATAKKICRLYEIQHTLCTNHCSINTGRSISALNSYLIANNYDNKLKESYSLQMVS